MLVLKNSIASNLPKIYALMVAECHILYIYIQENDLSSYIYWLHRNFMSSEILENRKFLILHILDTSRTQRGLAI